MPIPTILVVRRHRPLAGVRLAITSTLLPEDRTTRNGRPHVRIERMLVDLADDEPVSRLCWYLREADVRRMLDVDRLRATMQRNRGRRGTGRIQTALDRYLDGDNGVDNRAEAQFTIMLRNAGIRDVTNNKVLVLGGEIVRPDVWIEHAGLAVEIDERSHTLAPVMREDRLKEALMRAAGIPFVRVDDRDLANGLAVVLEALESIARFGTMTTQRGIIVPNVWSSAAST